MANTLIPQKTTDITNKIKPKTKKIQEIVDELCAMLIYLQHTYKMKDPIAIDPKIPNDVQVSRKLQTHKTLVDNLSKKYKNLKIYFGNGSRGNTGSKNRGLAFEKVLANDFKQWWNTDEISDDNDFILEEIIKHEKLNKISDFKVSLDGGKNQLRPLKVSGQRILIGDGLSVDIGKTISDITLFADKRPIYLSLKFGSTVTFFNAGIKTIIRDTEIAQGVIKDKVGVALLNMFGIDNSSFCAVFNGIKPTSTVVDVTNTINRKVLEDFIKSGIGEGYWAVHKSPAKMRCFRVTRQYTNEASKIQKAVVYYGGQTGTGRRVNIDVLTSKYRIIFNLRDKTGSGSGVSHIMADYTYIN